MTAISPGRTPVTDYLTVAEAMWKTRPVVASAVGGIQDQIEDQKNGVLLKDPSDLDGALAFATDATPESDVGDYTLRPGGVSSGNYTISFVDGTLSIDPAALTVAADAATRTYGGDNPDFTASMLRQGTTRPR